MTIKDSAKTIVCYGDSNTWGAKPDRDERYPRSIRWVSVLQSLLGDEYEVINEGLNGRTLVAEDESKTHRTGLRHLAPILKTNEPIYLVVIMLGTNDVKDIYNLSAQDIAKHLEQTISFINKEDSNIKILVVCPTKPVTPSDGDTDPRMVRAPKIFDELPALYKEVTDKMGCMFINASDYISSSLVDGYHLDPDSHKKLAEVLSEKIKTV